MTMINMCFKPVTVSIVSMYVRTFKTRFVILTHKKINAQPSI